MAYTPQTWVDNNASYPLSAARMNTMESGISNAASVADQGHRILTTAQRDALTGVTTGTTIYNSTLGQTQTYTGSAWIEIGNIANTNGVPSGLAPFFVSWTSYTPTLAQGVTTNIAKTVNQARYMKIGNTLFVNIYLVATGTGTANSAVTVSIPSGFTMAVNQVYLTGQGSFSDVSVTSYPVQPLYTTNTTVGFRRSDTTGVTQSIGSDPNIAVASGDTIFVSFVVEVTP